LNTIQIKLIPAIIGNYISCIITGLIIQGADFSSYQNNLIAPSLLLGIMFFVIFFAMGYVASHIGVGISSAASKLSLIIPAIYGAVFLKEEFGMLGFFALILSIPAVILMNYNKGEKMTFKSLSLPFLIFIGSGIIDTSLNLLEKHNESSNPSSIIITIFSAALLCSIVYSLIIKLPILSNRKSILFGLILGIPNYFSVHFMMLALGSDEFTSGEFYMINNSAVIGLSFLLAWLLFSEKITSTKAIGLLLAIVSIYLILYK
jgi:drug/metabolite transporter (DMT)-like permease